MDCARCILGEDCTESMIEGDESINGECNADEEASDIGGFTKNAGILGKLKSSEKQVGTPLEEDLCNWGHHFQSTSVPDSILQASAGDEVTFVFTNQVDGKLVPMESTKASPKMQEIDGKENLVKNPKFLHMRATVSAPSQRTTVKRMRTSLKGAANEALNSKLSFNAPSQLKRSFLNTTDHDNDDDDDFQ